MTTHVHRYGSITLAHEHEGGNIPHPTYGHLEDGKGGVVMPGETYNGHLLVARRFNEGVDIDTETVYYTDRLGLVWAWDEGTPYAVAYESIGDAQRALPATVLPDYEADMFYDADEPDVSNLMRFTEDSLMRRVRAFYMRHGTAEQRAAYVADLPYLTVGTVLDLLSDLPKDTPITAYGGNGLPEWLNLDLTAEAVEIYKEGVARGEGTSVMFDLRDDFDTRQW